MARVSTGILIRIASACTVVALAVGSGGAASAQSTCIACGPEAFSLSPVLSTGGGSGTLTVQGTLTNNTDATLYVNGDEFNVTSPLEPYVTAFDPDLPITVDGLSVAPHTAKTFDAFSISWAGVPDGLYPLLKLYGVVVSPFPDSMATPADYIDVTANQVFLQVTGGAVPEPATWSLLLTGFGGAGALLRRRRRRLVLGIAVQ